MPRRNAAGLFFLALAVLVGAHSASAFSTARAVALVHGTGAEGASTGSAPASGNQQEPQGEAETLAAADRPTPEEEVERRLDELRESGQPFDYYYVRPVSARAPGGTDAQPASTPRHAVDPRVTWDGYETQRAELDAIYSEIVAAGAARGEQGAEGARALYQSEAGDRLIAAAIGILDANGGDSPKAIKKLIIDGIEVDGEVRKVSKEHAALLWMARDLLVRRTMDRVKAELARQRPDFRFDITVLDSGSYGSIGSDIDKTLHLAAWDADGNAVKTFGPGGQVMGGDISAFLQVAFNEFNALGRAHGASNDISAAMDTEFFSTDTLPGRFATGATYASGLAALNASAEARRENFAALQRNPGPSYQFEGKVVAQVVGRTVEQDVLLQQRREELRAQREEITDLDSDDARSLYLDEMLTSIHSPAVVYEDGASAPRNIDVVDFLERNNLAVRYTADRAAENAFGDYEKLIHKWEKVIRPDGSFDLDMYQSVLNDIAKYGDRAVKDTATARVADDGGDKPPGMGDFNRRFGPADSADRFGKEAVNARPYTELEHAQLFRDALVNLHRNAADPDAEIQRDLDLYWEINGLNEDLLAIKANPALKEQFPEERLYEGLIAHLEQYAPEVLPDSPEARIRVAKQLHMKASVDAAVILAASNLERGLDMWLRDPKLSVDNLIRSEREKVFGLRRERLALRDRLEAASTPAERDALSQQISDISARIERVGDLMTSMEADPRGTRANIQSAGLELGRRVITLFESGDPNYQRMVGMLGPDYRRDLELMNRVWKVQASEAERHEIATIGGVDLQTVRAWTADTARRLANGYAEDFGIDVDAATRPPAGDSDGNPNRPDRILGRFIHDNYLQIGNAESALNLLRTMQLARGLPYEQRMQMLSESLTNELIGGVPGLGNVYSTYQGYKAGDGKAVAGGALNVAQELIEKWIGLAAGELEEEMVTSGLAGRVALLDNLGAIGSTATMYFSLARAAIEIVGHEAFEPVRDQYFQIAYKGFVDPQEAGLIRAGSSETANTIPVTPILEPAGADAVRFLYLRPEGAQRYLGELRRDGEEAAAIALLHLAGLDENVDSGFNPAGTCDPDPAKSDAGACPVTLDLETDFHALIAEARARSFTAASPALAQQAMNARDMVVDVWEGMAELQQVTRARIASDREARQSSPDSMNLWLLAARENLGWNLDAEFQRQAQLLYLRLVDPDNLVSNAQQTLVDEAAEAWRQWQAMAPGYEEESATGRRFTALMSPLAAYNNRIAAIQQQAAGVGSVSWLNPMQAVSELIGRQIRESQGWLTQQDVRRQAEADALQRQLAALGAFKENSYMNARVPTDPYVLSEATDWYAARINELRAGMVPPVGAAVRGGAAPVAAMTESPDELARRAAATRAEITRLQTEFGLVMQGFTEIDPVIAPKIAQLLLIDWMAGEGRFPNDVHAALQFLWTDADTQGRIRAKVVDDLVRGRRLIPAVQSQMSANRNLLEAALVDVRRQQDQAEQDAIRQKYRRALQLADAIADLMAEPPQFNGEMSLEVEPYLTVSPESIDVVVDAKVRHDVYRALEVEVETGARMIPYDAIEDVIGRARYDDALAQTGLDEEEVLFAVVSGARVTTAIPPPGHEQQAYTTLPESDGHLFLVPGRKPESEEDAPWIAADVTVQTCALRDEMQNDVAAEDTVEYCYDDDEPITIWDRVAVYFTPARDLSDGTDADKIFVWRIVNPNGRTVVEGDYFDAEQLGGSATPLMPAGSPGAFAARLPQRLIGDDSDPAKARIGPGVYTIQTADADFASGGELFGTVGTRIARSGEWVDEATFELQEMTLHYQGFVTEQFADRNMPPGDGILHGQWTLGPLRDAGGDVTLDMSAHWYLSEGRGGRPDPRTYRSSSTLRLGLPHTIDPAQDWVADFDVELVQHESGMGAAGSDYFFTAGMYLPVPTDHRPPDRFLIDGPDPWENTDVDHADWAFEPTSGRGVWFRDQREPFDDDEHGINLAGKARLRRGDPWKGMGEPRHSLSGHFHDPDAIFVFPVYVHLTDSLVPSHARYTATTYGYAVYEAEAGSYTAPLPTDLPPAGPDAPDDFFTDDTDASGEGGSVTPPGRGGAEDVEIEVPEVTTDDGAAVTSEDAGESGKEGADAVAEDAGEPGNEGGDAAAVGPGARPTLVVPDLMGHRADAARAELEAAGFAIAVSVEAEATSAAEAFTVVSQDPGPGTLGAPGTEVRLGIRGGFVGGSQVVVPSVYGQAAAAARERLEAEGFDVEMSIGAPADSLDGEYTVYRQTPDGGSRVAAGSLVQVAIAGEYLPTVPDLRGQDVDGARERLAELGLEASAWESEGAPSRAEEGEVVTQQPSPGTRVAAGSAVRLDYYGTFVDSRCDALLARARATRQTGDRDAARRQFVQAQIYECPGATEGIEALDSALDHCNELMRRSNRSADAGDWRAALASLRQARTARCTNPGIDQGISDLEERVAAEERLGRCNRMIERGRRQYTIGDLPGALATLERARADGCPNPGLDQSIADLQESLQPEPPPPPPPPPVDSSAGGGGGSYPERFRCDVPIPGIAVYARAEIWGSDGPRRFDHGKADVNTGYNYVHYTCKYAVDARDPNARLDSSSVLDFSVRFYVPGLSPDGEGYMDVLRKACGAPAETSDHIQVAAPDGKAVLAIYYEHWNRKLGDRARQLLDFHLNQVLPYAAVCR